MDSGREIVKRLFESKDYENDIKNEELDEASFDANGKHYSSAFGKYSCDGEPISREDYFKAKNGGSGAVSSVATDNNTSGNSKDQGSSSKSSTKSKAAKTSGSASTQSKDTKNISVDSNLESPKYNALMKEYSKVSSDYRKAYKEYEDFRSKNKELLYPPKGLDYEEERAWKPDEEVYNKCEELHNKANSLRDPLEKVSSKIVSYQNKELGKVDWKNLELKPVSMEEKSYNRWEESGPKVLDGLKGYIKLKGKNSHAIFDTSGNVFMHTHGPSPIQRVWSPNEKEMVMIKKLISSGKTPKSLW